MNPIDTQWNGMSVAYETDVQQDCYTFECDMNGEYEVNVNVPIDGPSIMPSGIPAHDERYVVQLNGQASQSRLPPYKTSTNGLRKPNVPNPYVDQSDDSKVYDDSYHIDAYANDGMFPTRIETATEDILPDSGHPKQTLYQPWQLGEKDQESMFNDYFYNDTDMYLQTMETVGYETQYFSSLAYGYEGAMNPQVVS